MEDGLLGPGGRDHRVSGSTVTPKRRARYPATARRRAGVPRALGYCETSGTAARSASRRKGGVGSRGSPSPKSNRAPFGRSLAFRSSSATIRLVSRELPVGLQVAGQPELGGARRYRGPALARGLAASATRRFVEPLAAGLQVVGLPPAPARAAAPGPGPHCRLRQRGRGRLGLCPAPPAARAMVAMVGARAVLPGAARLGACRPPAPPAARSPGTAALRRGFRDVGVEGLAHAGHAPAAPGAASLQGADATEDFHLERLDVVAPSGLYPTGSPRSKPGRTRRALPDHALQRVVRPQGVQGLVVIRKVWLKALTTMKMCSSWCERSVSSPCTVSKSSRSPS